MKSDRFLGFTIYFGVILSFGKNVKVIAPTELVNQIKEDSADILQMYKECDI